MGDGRDLTAKQALRRAKADLRGPVKEALDAGWTARDLGHGFRLVCPCPPPNHSSVAVPSTPANPSRAASYIAREIRRCPEHKNIPTA